MTLGRGDLPGIIPDVGTDAGRVDASAAIGGNYRRIRFTFEVWGFSEQPLYAPDAQITSEIHKVVNLRFPVLFAEPPFMSYSITLKPTDTNDPNIEDNRAQAYIAEYEPVLHACTMAWHRLEDHWGFVGADVAISVYDHPLSNYPEQFKMHVRLEFAGLALALPFAGDTATIPTTTKV